ncbi:peptidase inhibitor family I36 protein [Streptomyces sp. NPDC093509]|uniref:peptidase inhibitor family I36 protein n=1 Tax=Streptomyces sp. NPDC093509 TaxID=3154982 RepID=UPI00344FAE4E
MSPLCQCQLPSEFPLRHRQQLRLAEHISICFYEGTNYSGRVFELDMTQVHQPRENLKQWYFAPDSAGNWTSVNNRFSSIINNTDNWIECFQDTYYGGPYIINSSSFFDGQPAP